MPKTGYRICGGFSKWIEWGVKEERVGLPGIEPGTSRLSGVRSNRLSYKPTRGVLTRRDVREDRVTFFVKKHN